MKAKAAIPTDCPVCHAKFVSRRNVRGGRFEGCSNYDTTGCNVTWCHSDGAFHSLPWVVARRSKTRGVVVSQREETISIIIAMKGLTRDTAIEFLDAFGLDEVRRLLAA